MKRLLCFFALLFMAVAASAQGPILRQFGTTNTGPVLTNIIVSLAGGSSQTPWLQAINGNGFDLLSVADQTNTGTIQAAGFVGDGSGLTNLNGTEIRSGTVADARIASTIARDSEVLNATNGLAGALGTAAFSNSVSFLRAGVSVLDGSGLTNLNGTEIRSGTVADARIASTIARDSEVAAITLWGTNATSGYISNLNYGFGVHIDDTTFGTNEVIIFGPVSGLTGFRFQPFSFHGTAFNIDSAGDGTTFGTQTSNPTNFFQVGSVRETLPIEILTDLSRVYFGTNTVFKRPPTGDGSLWTNLNASELRSGTVPTARLGSGTANSTTFLRGDQTWATPAGGAQTPWTSDIDGGGFDLFDVGSIENLGNMTNVGALYIGFFDDPVWPHIFNIDGSGQIASGQILWDTSGSVTFQNQVTANNIIVGGNTLLNNDGSASLSAGALLIAADGQVTNTAWAGTGERYLQVLESGGVRAVNSTNSGGGVAGSDTQVQFNDASAFGGDAGLTYNKTTDALTVAGSVSSPLFTGNGAAGGVGKFYESTGVDLRAQIGTNDNLYLTNGSTAWTVTLTNGGGIFSSNVVASKFYGDGSQLTGITGSSSYLVQEAISVTMSTTATNYFNPANAQVNSTTHSTTTNNFCGYTEDKTVEWIRFKLATAPGAGTNVYFGILTNGVLAAGGVLAGNGSTQLATATVSPALTISAGVIPYFFIRSDVALSASAIVPSWSFGN